MKGKVGGRNGTRMTIISAYKNGIIERKIRSQKERRKKNVFPINVCFI